MVLETTEAERRRWLTDSGEVSVEKRLSVCVEEVWGFVSAQKKLVCSASGRRKKVVSLGV